MWNTVTYPASGALWPKTSSLALGLPHCSAAPETIYRPIQGVGMFESEPAGGDLAWSITGLVQTAVRMDVVPAGQSPFATGRGQCRVARCPADALRLAQVSDRHLNSVAVKYIWTRPPIFCGPQVSSAAM